MLVKSDKDKRNSVFQLIKFSNWWLKLKTSREDPLNSTERVLNSKEDFKRLVENMNEVKETTKLWLDK